MDSNQDHQEKGIHHLTFTKLRRYRALQRYDVLHTKQKEREGKER